MTYFAPKILVRSVYESQLWIRTASYVFQPAIGSSSRIAESFEQAVLQAYGFLARESLGLSFFKAITCPF